MILLQFIYSLYYANITSSQEYLIELVIKDIQENTITVWTAVKKYGIPGITVQARLAKDSLVWSNTQYL